MKITLSFGEVRTLLETCPRLKPLCASYALASCDIVWPEDEDTVPDEIEIQLREKAIDGGVICPALWT